MVRRELLRDTFCATLASIDIRPLCHHAQSYKELKGPARELGNEIMSSIRDAIDSRKEDLLPKMPKLN